MKSSKATKAKRRLGLSAGTNDDEPAKKEVKNPYLNPSATAASSPASNTKQAAATTTIATKTTSTVTPDADIDKFLVGKRKARDDAGDDDDDEVKPSVARKLVTPHDAAGPRTRTKTKQQQLLSRKSLKFTSEDVISGDLYYDSDDENTNNKPKPEGYVPVHIHSNVDYHRRGDVALNQGTLHAYRFIRNHFHVPKNLENDPKFGALSGSSFEERVIRAYSLGQLEPNMNGKRMMKPGSSDGNLMLLVCSYCGDEGHKRDGCSKLL